MRCRDQGSDVWDVIEKKNKECPKYGKIQVKQNQDNVAHEPCQETHACFDCKIGVNGLSNMPEYVLHGTFSIGILKNFFNLIGNVAFLDEQEDDIDNYKCKVSNNGTERVHHRTDVGLNVYIGKILQKKFVQVTNTGNLVQIRYGT